MNVLPFVFAILFVLSYGTVASLQSRLSMHRTQKAYSALRGAEKKILRSSELEQFKALSGASVEKKEKQKTSKEKKEKSKSISYPLNPFCAQLNLYPLIEEGKEAHSALYEKAADLLRMFYQNRLFVEEKRFEYRFLDSLIEGAKKSIKDQASVPLETIAMKDPELQTLYYRCLKGTKSHDSLKKGYPPLIDYMKIDKGSGKICLVHCHPYMLNVFFGFKTAQRLYQELHDEGRPREGINLESILQWGCDPQLAFIDPKVWDLIDFKKAKHGNLPRQTLAEQEDGVCIRKNVSLKS